MKVIVFITILLWVAKDSYPKCQKYEVKSDIGIRERYLTGGFYHYRYAYPNLYDYVVCENETLTLGEELDLGNETGDNVKNITFINSEVKVIFVGLFKRFTSASQIYLNNSNVTLIEPRAFGGMTNLNKLMLQQNHLNVIFNWTFADLKNVTAIDLSENTLSEIHSYAFADLTKLEKLSLAYNQIAVVDDSIFSFLTELKLLNISNNQIKTISDNAFLYVNKLKNVSFAHNRLRRAPKFYLPNATLDAIDLSYNELADFNFAYYSASVQKLNLSSNRLENINWPSIKNFNNLDLSNNGIVKIAKIGRGVLYLNLKGNDLTNLDSALFQSSGLIELDLSNNKIKLFQQDTFDGSSELRFLNLENNQLDFVPIGGFHDLTNLESLSLSYNNLTDLDFGTFRGLQSLRKLFLNNNNLSVIRENSFHVFNQLEQLTLDHNHLMYLDAKMLTSHIFTIKNMSLHNNDWTCHSLFEMLKILLNEKVGILKGPYFDVPNVEGIRCTSENKLLTTEASNQADTTRNDFVNSLDAYFANSSFFNYFNNLLSDGNKKELENENCSLEDDKLILILGVIGLLCVIAIMMFIGLICFCCKHKNRPSNEKLLIDDFEL